MDRNRTDGFLNASPRARRRLTRTEGRLLLPERVLRGVFARAATEHHGVGDGVAAQAVEAVHAARHFTRGVKARNRTALDVEHFAFGRDGDAPIVW